MRIGVTSVHEFAAAHSLPYHPGKEQRKHGHNYRVECTRYGTPRLGTGAGTGMVVDVADFDAEIERVLESLDRFSLNDDVGIVNPTAEHLAIWLLYHLPMVDKVVVWETSKRCAHAEREQTQTGE